MSVGTNVSDGMLQASRNSTGFFRCSKFHAILAGLAGGMAINISMLLTFRLLGFGWNADGILLHPVWQSPKLIAVEVAAAPKQTACQCSLSSEQAPTCGGLIATERPADVHWFAGHDAQVVATGMRHGIRVVDPGHRLGVRVHVGVSHNYSHRNQRRFTRGP